MQEVRYTGDDIAVDIVLQNNDKTLIDPTTLAAIYVYAVDQDGQIVAKYADPAKVDYQAIEVIATKVTIWLQSDLTKTLAGKRIHIELNTEEVNDDLDDSKQNSIVLSDEILIKHAPIEAES